MEERENLLEFGDSYIEYKKEKTPLHIYRAMPYKDSMMMCRMIIDREKETCGAIGIFELKQGGLL
jgi:hypothetical protein